MLPFNLMQVDSWSTPPAAVVVKLVFLSIRLGYNQERRFPLTPQHLDLLLYYQYSSQVTHLPDFSSSASCHLLLVAVRKNSSNCLFFFLLKLYNFAFYIIQNELCLHPVLIWYHLDSFTRKKPNQNADFLILFK